jgi:SAM-dependent methyltransferase
MNHSEHVERNREQWDTWAPSYVDAGERNWQAHEPSWGIWSIPESDAQLFRGIERFAGVETLELGCGTGYVSAWLARAGATATGIDISANQLATARRLQTQHSLTSMTFIEASGEQLPFEDESFNLAISEYGVCLWCDPYRWVPEASRVLRPGGELIFLTNGLLSTLCAHPKDGRDTTTLQRPLFGLHANEWPHDASDNSVEFHLPHGEWIRLLHEHGLQVEALIELQRPDHATTTYSWADPSWAQEWPCEEVWIARKKAT